MVELSTGNHAAGTARGQPGTGIPRWSGETRFLATLACLILGRDCDRIATVVVVRDRRGSPLGANASPSWVEEGVALAFICVRFEALLSSRELVESTLGYCLYWWWLRWNGECGRNHLNSTNSYVVQRSMDHQLLKLEGKGFAAFYRVTAVQDFPSTRNEVSLELIHLKLVCNRSEVHLVSI